MHPGQTLRLWPMSQGGHFISDLIPSQDKFCEVLLIDNSVVRFGPPGSINLLISAQVIVFILASTLCTWLYL